jgi:hypothetical protein
MAQTGRPSTDSSGSYRGKTGHRCHLQSRQFMTLFDTSVP